MCTNRIELTVKGAYVIRKLRIITSKSSKLIEYNMKTAMAIYQQNITLLKLLWLIKNIQNLNMTCTHIILSDGAILKLGTARYMEYD